MGAGRGDKTTLFFFFFGPTTWALAPWIRSPPSGFLIGPFLAATHTTGWTALQGCTAACSRCQQPPALHHPRGLGCQIICTIPKEWLKLYLPEGSVDRLGGLLGGRLATWVCPLEYSPRHQCYCCWGETIPITLRQSKSEVVETLVCRAEVVSPTGQRTPTPTSGWTGFDDGRISYTATGEQPCCCVSAT